MDTNIMEPQSPEKINKKIIFISVAVIVIIISVFFVSKYTSYLDFLKTNTGTDTTPPSTTLSAQAQKELAELDNLRKEYQERQLSAPSTATVESELASLDALRKKAQKQTTSKSTPPKTTEQQLAELDVLRAKAQLSAASASQ